MSESSTRTLIVTRTQERVRAQDGKDWVIYTVWATTAEGAPVTEELRSFSPLTDYWGKPTLYTVDRHEHPKYGVSFTLSPPKVKTSARVEKLEHQVAELTGRIEQLESRLPASGSPAAPAAA